MALKKTLSLQRTKKFLTFWVLGLRNEFGPYLMAETVIDGNAIDLQAYYNDSSLAADERLQEALRELLAGFEQDGETPVLEK